MSTTRTSEAEIASELAQRLTGVPGYSPGQERELVRAFHAAAAAVEVGDDVAAVVLGAWWWPYRLSVLARALNAQAAHVLGWRARPPRRWTSFSGAGGPGGLTRARTRALVDVNTAPAAELATLPGLGPVTARRIVGARPYRRVRDVRTAAG
ncbi:MAG: helix-hairpin-helix domain-containing protein, partial [Gaiellaceae bacterium]